VFLPGETGPEPTPSLLRKRSAEAYPGGFLTPSACMIDELRCKDVQMGSRDSQGRDFMHLPQSWRFWIHRESRMGPFGCPQLVVAAANTKPSLIKETTKPERNKNMQGNGKEGKESRDRRVFALSLFRRGTTKSSTKSSTDVSARTRRRPTVT